MRATISGQAGIAITEEVSGTMLLYSIDDPDQPIPVNSSAFDLALTGATDVIALDVRDRAAALKLLQIEWKRDRLLQMLILLLRKDVGRKVRREAAEIARLLIECEEARIFARDRLHSRPLTDDADLNGAIKISHSVAAERLESLLVSIRQRAAQIELLTERWNVMEQTFADPASASRFRQTLESSGIWYALVVAADTRTVSGIVRSVGRDKSFAGWPAAESLARHLAAALRIEDVPVKAPPLSRSMEAEEFFLSHLGTIESIVAYIARSNRLDSLEAEEFQATVKLELIENNFALIRGFEGRSSFSTFLTALIQRMFYQHRVRLWGKWRPSAEARRLGDKAIALERLMSRDGLSFHEVVEMMTTGSGAQCTVAELEAIYARLPPRQPRPVLVSGDAVPETAAIEDDKDSRVQEEKRASIARAVAEVLDRCIAEADPEDQVILRMRFWNGRRVPDVARALQLDQRKVYKRIERMLSKIRHALEVSGVSQSDVDEILIRSDIDVEWTATSTTETVEKKLLKWL